MTRWPNRDKIPSAVWHWVLERMSECSYNTIATDYDNWYDFYRGRQWEQESTEFEKARIWKITHNEIRSAMDAHIAHLLKTRIRSYHVNIGDTIRREERAINMFITRATKDNTDIFRKDALHYGYIGGASILELRMAPMLNPIGVRALDNPTGKANLRLMMPKYQAYPVWQWLFDPRFGSAQRSNWAVKFFVMSRKEAKKLAKRNVEDILSDAVSEFGIKRRFKDGTSPTYKVRSNSLNAQFDTDMLLGAELYFRETDIGVQGDTQIEGDERWRMIRIVGDYLQYFNTDPDLSFMDAPMGQEVGIPADVFCPFRQSGYIIGSSFIQIGKDIQRDLNAKRALASEVVQLMAGVIAVRSPASDMRKVIAQLQKQRGTGFIGIPPGTTVERQRGERIDASLMQDLLVTEDKLRRMIGVPDILQGVNPTGTYSAEQAKLLQSQANVVMAMRLMEFGDTLARLGQKEWSAIQYFWRDKAFMLDDGIEWTAIVPQVLDYPGWKAEAVPETTYIEQIVQEQSQTLQAAMGGIPIDPRVLYSKMSFLTPTEREACLAFATAQMQAQAQAAQQQPTG